MIKLDLFFVLLLGLLVVGCKNQEKQRVSEQEVITPLNAENEITDLLPYMDSVAIIPLETTEKSLVNTVDKMLLLPNGHILIKSTNTMLLFSSEGKFLFQIGQPGRGPEEYNYVGDICLSQDGEELWILDDERIVKYSTKDGRFIRKTKLELPDDCPGFRALASGPGQMAFLCYYPRLDKNNFPEDLYNVFCYDEQGEIVGRFLPRKDYGISMALITQSWNNQYILRPQDNSNICYYLSDSVPLARVRIDFGKKTLTDRYSADIQTYLGSPYYKMPVYIHDTQENFYFVYCGPEATEHYCVHSFKTHHTIAWKRTGQDVEAMFQILGSDKDFFYGIYNDYRNVEEMALNEQDLLKRAIIQKTQIQIPDDENPFLVKMRFKL